MHPYTGGPHLRLELQRNKKRTYVFTVFFLYGDACFVAAILNFIDAVSCCEVHRQPKLSIRVPSDVTLAYKRCSVTKIRFSVRVCMGTQRLCFKSKNIVFFVNNI